MGAILPSLVTGADEWFTTVRTGQVILRLCLAFVIGIPPSRAAFVRAELTRSVFALHRDGLITLLTDRRGVCGFFAKPRPTAAGLNRVFRNRERFGNFRIGATLIPHGGNPFFLFGRHSLVLRSEEYLLKTRWT